MRTFFLRLFGLLALLAAYSWWIEPPTEHHRMTSLTPTSRLPILCAFCC